MSGGWCIRSVDRYEEAGPHAWRRRQGFYQLTAVRAYTGSWTGWLRVRVLSAKTPAGPVNLTVQTLGYASKTVTEVAVAAGHVAMPDVAMACQAIPDVAEDA